MSGWDFGQLALVDTVWRSLICDIGQVDVTTLLFASDQSVPCIAALADDLLGILLVLAFTAEGELVLGFSIWDLVDTEPFVGSAEETRKVTLNIFNVVQFGSERVVDLNLPVSRVMTILGR